jgi:hypothetical protein
MRKTPINTATVDQASSDLKRETPINARIMAETTDTTLSPENSQKVMAKSP